LKSAGTPPIPSLLRVVEIGDGLISVVVHRRSGAVGEAVADKQNAAAVCSVTDQATREDQAGDERKRARESGLHDRVLPVSGLVN
jgi:hypothetical protein